MSRPDPPARPARSVRAIGCAAPLLAVALAAALGLRPVLLPVVLIVGLWLSRLILRLSGHGRPPRRTLKFTREGRYLVAITLGVGFAAINTGNNLLYLILGMLLSMIVVSGVLSEHTLRKLTVERDLPRSVHAGRPFLTGITLTNHKRRLPSFSVQVEDVIEGRTVAKKCYFLKVPAEACQQTSYRAEFPRRGAYSYEGLRIGTRFPFAFFIKSRQLMAPASLVVLPRVDPVADLPMAARSMLGVLIQPRRGQGREFHGLRDYRTGDDARDVSWKRSAREGRLILREYARQGTRRLVLMVNDRLTPDEAEGPAVADACCDLAASLLVHLGRKGFAVDLWIGAVSHLVESEGQGLHSALRALALVQFSTAPETLAGPVSAGPQILVTPRATRALVSGRFSHVVERGA